MKPGQRRFHEPAHLMDALLLLRPKRMPSPQGFRQLPPGAGHPALAGAIALLAALGVLVGGARRPPAAPISPCTCLVAQASTATVPLRLRGSLARGPAFARPSASSGSGRSQTISMRLGRCARTRDPQRRLDRPVHPRTAPRGSIACAYRATPRGRARLNRRLGVGRTATRPANVYVGPVRTRTRRRRGRSPSPSSAGPAPEAAARQGAHAGQRVREVRPASGRPLGGRPCRLRADLGVEPDPAREPEAVPVHAPDRAFSRLRAHRKSSHRLGAPPRKPERARKDARAAPGDAANRRPGVDSVQDLRCTCRRRRARTGRRPVRGLASLSRPPRPSPP